MANDEESDVVYFDTRRLVTPCDHVHRIFYHIYITHACLLIIRHQRYTDHVTV